MIFCKAALKTMCIVKTAMQINLTWLGLCSNVCSHETLCWQVMGRVCVSSFLRCTVRRSVWSFALSSPWWRTRCFSCSTSQLSHQAWRQIAIRLYHRVVTFWMCIQGCSWKLRFGRVVEWSACRWCNINHCFRKRNPMAALGRALCVCWDKSVSFINLSFVFVFVLQNVKHPCLFSWICSDQKPNRGSEEVRGCLASNTLMHLTCPAMLHATQHVKKQINNGEKCIIKQVLYRT